MILCKGKNCKWKKECSRYVIGKGMARVKGYDVKQDENNTWIDHCLHAKKFIKIKN